MVDYGSSFPSSLSRQSPVDYRGRLRFCRNLCHLLGVGLSALDRIVPKKTFPV